MFAALLIFAGSVQAVPLWGRFETSVTNAGRYRNPFTDVALRAVFTRPDQSNVSFFGFHDGDGKGGQEGQVWKLRFMPDQIGTWHYECSFSDGAAGAAGTFECQPDGAKPGPLRVDPDNRHFWTFADGTRFWPRAFTAPELFLAENEQHRRFWVEHFFGGKHRFNLCNANLLNFVGTGGELNWQGTPYKAPDPAQAGRFVTIRGNGLFPFLYTGEGPRFDGGSNVDWFRPNVACWANADAVLNELEQHGAAWFNHWGMIGWEWSGNGRLLVPLAARTPVLRYWIARLAPYWNITWNIAGEWDELLTPAELDELGVFIRESDPWKHPVTSHALGTTVDRPWVDFRVQQFSAGTSSDAITNARRAAADYANKPIFAFETSWEATPGKLTPDQVRTGAWGSVMGGAFYLYAECFEPTLTWGDGGSFGFVEIMHDFFSRLPFRELSPAPALVDKGSLCLAAPGKRYVVYRQSGGTMAVDLANEKRDPAFTAEWLDPRTGAKKATGTVTGGAKRSFECPDERDWVLHLARTTESTEWDTYGGDPTGAKFSKLQQINRSNVKVLKPAWIYRCDDMRAGSTIECNPIIIGGLLYITTPGLKVVALDAATGQQRWVFDPWAGKGGRGVNRGVTWWSAEDGSEARIFFVSGTTLHALDALTGLPMNSFGTDGKIDLREGLDRDVYFLQVGATSPGIVYKDLLILGSIVGEGPGPSAPGHIRAFDARTGKRRWIFHTIPHPGESGYDTWPPNAWKTIGGANCWGGMTLDEKRGIVFCGTGSPSYDHWGGNRIGQNLFANCVLALRAETGERVWHYQVVHHDLWDYDIPAPPNLVTVNHGGRSIDAVAQVTKFGHLFVLDRETGQPLFPVEERPVPKSDIPGEQSWPTQPFPLKPPPFAQQGFTESNVTDRTPEARAAVLTKLREMRTGGVFIPPGLKPSVVLPQFNGGAEWGGAAFDSDSRTLYVNSSSEAEWISMVPARPPADITLNELGRTLYGTVCSSCHGFEQAKLPNAPAFASLKSVKQRLTRAQVAELLETGRGQMPSFKTFSVVEKRAVTAFLFDDGNDERLATKDLKLSWADEIPFVATGHHEFRDLDGFPANRPPWGTLTAIDLDSGNFRWQVPLGNYPALAAKGLPPTGTFNIGGPLVTAGGLVFIGAAMDEKFHAFDAKTGELLWEFQMEAGGYATPATYQLGDRQYVIIAAGGGGKPETKPGNAYYCFALEGKN